ncbi:hypothetical protein MYX77_03080 [Acidobacteriia bacterium AH_259_A11_L15]|nr:hypothetical protein [Acidobacteriia bacterium AH_259_A11_L15]
MASIEQSVKSQFAKVFAVSDWSLLKKVAESNLKEAAKLLKRDMPIETTLKLLARNSRKRLLIGVGVELLVKAVYLKHGYMINKPPKGSPLTFPFSAQDAAGVQLVADQTFMLNDLIENLPKVVQLQSKHSTLKGLKIAKVFRNKEGHGVTSAHAFDASNYTDIASSLSALYRDAFGEKLSVRFSMAPNESAVWRISRPNKRF